MSTTTHPLELEVVHTHTRAEAIADGTLVDVTAAARKAGFVFPVALSAAAWADTVAWSEGNVALQDEAGRLWDVLMVARLAATRSKSARVAFEVLRIPNSRRARGARLASLVLHIGPGDDLRPVLTVMLPHED
jgi:hypothetical protein